jgi:hypothetical protein
MPIDWKAISQQKKVKQETLEEVKNNALDNYEHVEGNLYSTSFKNGFEIGVEWYVKNLKVKVQKAIDVIEELPIDEVSKQGGISTLKLILNK